MGTLPADAFGIPPWRSQSRGCEPVALDFVGWPDSATPNPEEHLRLGWCTFRAGDLIVVDGKLFAAVFLVRFIAPISRLHAVKAALSSSSQALIAFSKASPWSQHHEHHVHCATLRSRTTRSPPHERGQDGY